MIVDEFYKNIIILGNNGTGIAAALKLSRLFKNHYNVKIHLISNNFNIRYHLALRLFSSDLKEKTPNDRLKKNLEYHRGTATKVDLINRKVFFDDDEIHFRFIAVDITNQNYYQFIQGDIRRTGKAESLTVYDFMRETELPFVYLFRDNVIKRLDTDSLVSSVNSITQKQESQIARNIFSEVYGYERIMQT